jgi:hypothetical protein
MIEAPPMVEVVVTDQPPLLKAGTDEKSCPTCGGQLAIIRGPIFLSAGKREDSPRDKRQCFVGCPRCDDKPVDVAHPWQIRLDKAWDELEAKEKEAKEKAAKMPKAPAATGASPILDAPRAVEVLADAVSRLQADFKKALERISALERKSKLK